MVIRMKLEGVNSVHSKRTGNTYHYHRKSGTRILAPYGTAGFAVELDQIDKAWKQKTARKGTFGDLVDQYRAAPEFLRLKPVTKKDYERIISNLASMRALPISTFDRAVVTDLRNKAFRKHKRRHANYLIQVLSRIFNIGIGLGLATTNPAQHVEKIRKATGEGNRNRPWTSMERDAVLAAAPIQLKAPIALMRYLGVRLGDVRRMTNDAYQGGMISFITGKGDVDVTVPCPKALAEILDQRLPHPDFMFVSTDGSGWTEGGFHASFRKLRDKLILEGKVKPGITPHGLRHSVATDLRELGATEREIADILGQRTTYAVPTYSRTADMKRSNAKQMTRLHGEDKEADLFTPLAKQPAKHRRLVEVDQG